MLPFLGTIDGLMSTADFGGSEKCIEEVTDDDCAKVPLLARCVGTCADLPTLRA